MRGVRGVRGGRGVRGSAPEIEAPERPVGPQHVGEGVSGGVGHRVVREPAPHQPRVAPQRGRERGARVRAEHVAPQLQRGQRRVARERLGDGRGAARPERVARQVQRRERRAPRERQRGRAAGGPEQPAVGAAEGAQRAVAAQAVVVVPRVVLAQRRDLELHQQVLLALPDLPEAPTHRRVVEDDGLRPAARAAAAGAAGRLRDDAVARLEVRQDAVILAARAPEVPPQVVELVPRVAHLRPGPQSTNHCAHEPVRGDTVADTRHHADAASRSAPAHRGSHRPSPPLRLIAVPARFRASRLGHERSHEHGEAASPAPGARIRPLEMQVLSPESGPARDRLDATRFRGGQPSSLMARTVR